MSVSFAFSGASLSDCGIPDFLKQKLWRSRLAANTSAMQVISALTVNGMDTESCYRLVEDILQATSLMERYADNYFGNRRGKLPAEVYYAVLGRSYIEHMPDAFRHLPPEYERIAGDLRKIDIDSSLLSSNALHPMARFAHAIEKYIDLKDYRRKMRIGIKNIDPARNTYFYNALVQHIKNNFTIGSDLNNDLLFMTNDVDYIINALDEDLAWYINMGIEYKERVFDKNFVFDDMGLPDLPHVRNIFSQIYSFYEDKYPEDEGYSAYYEFSEKVMAPLSILGPNAGDEITDVTLMYAMAAPAICEAENPQDFALSLNFRVASVAMAVECSDMDDMALGKIHTNNAHLDTINASLALCDLTYHYLRMRPNEVVPFVSHDQMTALHQKLIGMENLACPPALKSYIDHHHGRASKLYNSIVSQNGKLFEPYHGPKLT